MNLESKPNHPELKPPSKTLADLYPQLSPEEQSEAAYNLQRYVNLVWRIYQRIRRQSSEESGTTEQPENAEKFDDNPFKR